TDVMISNCKIKAKSEILIRAFDKNHVTLVTHVTHMISVKSLDKTEVDQKTVFSSKNVIKRQFRSEEHTSELQSRRDLVCRLLLDTATSEIYTLSLHDALPIY